MTVLAILWVWAFLRVFRLVMWGCTVGQRIAGIRVVRLDDLRFPSWKQAFSRWSPTWDGAILVLVLVLVFLLIT